MLDVRKKYFVDANGCSLGVITRWASRHMMKVKEKPVPLPTCGRAYELDVEYSDGLKIGTQAGAVYLFERGTVIGRVSYDLVMIETCAVIHTDFAS